MAEMYGKAEGCSGGRGGSMHLFDAATNFYGGNAIVGGGLPLAGGLALADKMTGEGPRHGLFLRRGRRGRGRVPRDAEPGELWDLPVLFVCENNGYAMGTAIGRIRIRDRHPRQGRRLQYRRRSRRRHGRGRRRGRHAPRHASASANRAAFISWNATPTGSARIPCSTPSSTATRPRSRVAREGADRALPGLASGKRADPRKRRRRDRGRVDAEIAEAVAFAEAGTWEPVEEPDPKHVSARSPRRRPPGHAIGETVEMTYREAVKQAIRDAMIRDERVFLMGEDVGAYGGCYAVSKGLMDEFGEDRIRDTPLSESGFTGAGIGAAAAGMRPIVELMTVNFSLLALDQIMNTAATIRHMSGGQFGVPLVIRMATGAGKQLAAQHSHSLEGWYAHIPG
jgi:2-oxoisovalerate dehydrogenase E1 component